MASDSPFASRNSPGFADLLDRLGITLLATTYQAGKLMAVRGQGGRIATLLRSFERPMGLAVRSTSPGAGVRGEAQFALGTRSQVWFYRAAPELARQVTPVGQHDACFLPRASHVTGDIRCHEIAWIGAELWIVNTLFSCLCTLDAEHNFVPRWRPPFLAGTSPGDHCHLNGLAAHDGQPRYVTALGETTTPQGWRDGKASGGVLIDVGSGAVICRGLSMPHSPRVHQGQVWLLESGTGQLQTVDLDTGRRTLVAQLPGFARGLALCGSYAFVGLSRIREKSTFGDLPIASASPAPVCGIWVIDLRTGAVAEFLRFDAGVEEIFAVEVLPECRFPEIVGFQDDTIHGAFSLPTT